MSLMLRSLLFVPGDNQDRIAKAAASSADAVIIDLEDAVHLETKSVARAALPEAVNLLRRNGKYAIVRINTIGVLRDLDMAAVIDQDCDAIMVPKVEDAASLAELGRALAQRRWPAPRQQPSLIALIESARGVIAASHIAEVARVSALALGSEDFALSMGVKPEPANLDLPVRSLALAANANGKAAFAMPLSIAAFRDSEAIRGAAVTARSYGCHGALCIHPIQVEAVNAAFTPAATDVEEARAILESWASARDSGKGLVVLGNRMIDAPVVAQAELVLRRAGSLAQ